MRVLIVPTNRERRTVLRKLRCAKPVPDCEAPTWRTGDLLIIESGMGPKRIAELVPHLSQCRLQAVWLSGWCGGLSEHLRVGDLILADATVLADGARILHPPSDALVRRVKRLAAALGQQLCVGPVLTSDRVLVSLADKRAGAATGSLAVEMEAGPLARWTAVHELAFVHLRVVLDPVTSALPSANLQVNADLADPAHALLLRVLTRPREWAAILRLLWQADQASRVMTRVIQDLAEPGGPLAG